MPDDAQMHQPAENQVPPMAGAGTPVEAQSVGLARGEAHFLGE